jgi:hypothetical protein
MKTARDLVKTCKPWIRVKDTEHSRRLLRSYKICQQLLTGLVWILIYIW